MRFKSVLASLVAYWKTTWVDVELISSPCRQRQQDIDLTSTGVVLRCRASTWSESDVRFASAPWLGLIGNEGTHTCMVTTWRYIVIELHGNTNLLHPEK